MITTEMNIAANLTKEDKEAIWTRCNCQRLSSSRLFNYIAICGSHQEKRRQRYHLIALVAVKCSRDLVAFRYQASLFIMVHKSAFPKLAQGVSVKQLFVDC